MKNLFIYLSVFFSFFAISASNPTLADSNDWQPNPDNNQILPQIKSSVGSSAITNITDAEQVFCYQITNRPENYRGYTIDGQAIVGFCGIINNELLRVINSELFMNPQNINFNMTENCVVKPQIMLRFVRGVDFTDVLLSSPCHAMAIFYGGTVNAFNAKPAAPIINALIEALQKNKTDFASPALFNQLLPVGIAQNNEQRELLNQKNAPIRNWVKDQKLQEQKRQKNGWNNLNLKM